MLEKICQFLYQGVTNSIPPYSYQECNPYLETENVYHHQQWMHEMNSTSNNTNQNNNQFSVPYPVENNNGNNNTKMIQQSSEIPGFYPYENQPVYINNPNIVSSVPTPGGILPSEPNQNFHVAPPIAEFQTPIESMNMLPSTALNRDMQQQIPASGLEMSRFLEHSEHAGDIAAAVALDTNKARQHFTAINDGLDYLPKRTEVVTEEDGRAILFESKNDALLETRTVGGRRYKLKSASKMAPNKRKARIAANNRERRRMKVINDGFTMLRRYIPIFPHETKLSKIDTLKLAMHYITVMDEIRKTPLSELYKDERYYGCHLLNSERSMADKLRAEAENGSHLTNPRPIFTLAQTNLVMDRIYADIENDIQSL